MVSCSTPVLLQGSDEKSCRPLPDKSILSFFRKCPPKAELKLIPFIADHDALQFPSMPTVIEERVCVRIYKRAVVLPACLLNSVDASFFIRYIVVKRHKIT